MPRHACMVRVNRMFDGAFKSLDPRRFECKGYDIPPVHELRTTEIAWRLGQGVDCDESAAFVPNSLMLTTGTSIRREDDFVHFSGRLNITDFPTGSPPIHLFQGRMDLLGKVGSHQDLGELCAEPEHFEGWISAKGQGDLAGYRLRCVVVGGGLVVEGITGSTLATRISGVLLRPHP